MIYWGMNNTEMINKIEEMLDIYKEIEEIMQELVNKDFTVEFIPVGLKLVEYLRRLDNTKVTRTFYNSIFSSLEALSLELGYMLPSFEEE